MSEDQAESLYRRALTITEEAQGPNHLSVTIPLNNLAEFLSSKGQYSEAAKLYQRIIRLHITEDIFYDSPYTPIVLNNLAEVYRHQRKLELAQATYQQSIRLKQKHLGDHHPSVAITLNNLGLLNYQLGNPGKAIEQFENALKIFEESLGPDHPYTLKCLDNLERVRDHRDSVIEQDGNPWMIDGGYD